VAGASEQLINLGRAAGPPGRQAAEPPTYNPIRRRAVSGEITRR
jgi:hypothetical protein